MGKKRINVGPSDIEQPIGILKDGMKVNNNDVNDFMHNNTVTKEIGDATVPSVVKIFASTVGSVSYGCLDNRACDF